jgi:hypothetical protein
MLIFSLPGALAELAALIQLSSGATVIVWLVE